MVKHGEAVIPGVERLLNWPLDAFGRQAGVYLNDSCLVVLTRTIGVSALDGLLLGWESWLGHSFWPYFFVFS